MRDCPEISPWTTLGCFRVCCSGAVTREGMSLAMWLAMLDGGGVAAGSSRDVATTGELRDDVRDTGDWV